MNRIIKLGMLLLTLPWMAAGANSDTRVVVWGSNDFGQTNVPPEMTNIMAMSVGETHILCVTSDGAAVAWGRNENGEGTVPLVAKSGVQKVAAGGSHSVALKTNGSVVAWGADRDGATAIPPEAQSGVKAIAAGVWHTVALKTNGVVLAWGDNTHGQRTVPSDATNITAIAAGVAHTMALRSDGTVLSWGQLQTANVTGVIAIAAGSLHGVALKSDGSVVAWGLNDSGQCTVPAAARSGVMAIAAGGEHTVALKNDGTLLVWGGNTAGQTSIPPEAMKGIAGIAAGANCTMTLQAIPSIVTSPTNQAVVISNQALFRVEATTDFPPLKFQWQKRGVNITGATHQHLVLSNVQPSDCDYYQVVVSDAVRSVRTAPVTLTLLNVVPTITSSAASRIGHSWARLDGSYNPNGDITQAFFEYGLTTNYGARTLIGDPVLGASTLSFTNMVIGLAPHSQFHYRLVCRNSSGEFYGPDQVFQTPGKGFSDLGAIAWPEGPVLPSSVLRGLSAVSVGGVYITAAAVRKDGSVVVWGVEPIGQGNIPVAAQSGVSNISVGSSHIVAVKSNGTAVAWGDGSEHSTIPPAARTGVVAVSAGNGFTLALKTNGTVVAWGINDQQQATVPLAAQSGVKAVSAGEDFSLALKESGQVIAWGANAFGQCNVPPEAASRIIAVAAGPAHSLALREDGTVVAWGIGDYGQTNVPAAAVDIVGIATGRQYSLALKSDGSVLAWGRSEYGQSTVPLAAGKGVVAIDACDYYSVALQSIPAILQHPLNQVAQTGTDVTFTVSATTDNPPLSYQWERNGTNISGATSSTLTLPNAQPTNAASYTVVVSDSLASTRSAVAQLTFTNTIPTIAPRPGVAGVGWALLTASYNPQGAPATAYFEYGPTTNYGFKTPAKPSSSQGYEIGVTNLLTGVTKLPAGSYHFRFVAANAKATVFGPDQQFEILDWVDGKAIAWGENTYGQLNVPIAAQTGIKSVAAGGAHTLALKKDGSVIGWGLNNRGQTNVPLAAKANVTAIAAGGGHSVALKSDGTKVEWPSLSNFPYGGLQAIAAGGSIYDGGDFTVGIQSNGNLQAWGDNLWGAGFLPPGGVSNVVAVTAGPYYWIALKRDGTIAQRGGIYAPGPPSGAPESLASVVALAAAGGNCLALRNDSSVIAWPDAEHIPIQARSGVVAIAASASHSLALKSDGSVVSWGSRTTVPDEARSGIIGIAAGNSHSVALRALPMIVSQPISQTVPVGSMVTLEVTGRSITSPLSYQWKKDGVNIQGATNRWFTLLHAEKSDAGSYTVVVSDQIGSVTSAAAMLAVTGLARPSLDGPALTAGHFSVAVKTEPGSIYYLERKNDLNQPAWTTVLNMMGDGAVQSLVDTNAAANQAFYRLRVQ